jgi:acyl carrier protein
MIVNNLHSKMARILCRHFLISPDAVKTRKKFQDLGLNPMEVNEVFNYIETEFKISLDDQETGQISTVGDALQAVERHLLPQYGRTLVHA